MNFEGKLREWGPIDIGPLRQRIAQVTEAEWDANMMVQKANSATHSETRVLVLFWPDDVSDPVTGAEQPLWPEYKELVLPVFERLESIYGPGRPSRAMFAKLRPGASIPEHPDRGLALQMSHRCHIPIFTNDGVDFQVEGERVVMQEGHLYELNNQRMHSVANHGGEGRVHLIVDWHHGDCECYRKGHPWIMLTPEERGRLRSLGAL